METRIQGNEGLQPFRKLIQDLQHFLKQKEPASNYDMPIRNRKLKEEQARREAEEKKKAEESGELEKKAKPAKEKPAKEEKTDKPAKEEKAEKKAAKTKKGSA